MIFNAKNTSKKKVKVFAYPGLEIKYVKKYNTRTRMIEMFILGETRKGLKRVLTVPIKKGRFFSRKVFTVKVKIPGSFIVINGKKY